MHLTPIVLVIEFPSLALVFLQPSLNLAMSFALITNSGMMTYEELSQLNLLFGEATKMKKGCHMMTRDSPVAKA